jgi:fused signal recognition particle receptor
MISLLIIVALLLVLGFGLGLVRTRQRALSGREAAGRVDAGSGEERSATTKEAEAVAAPPEEPAAALPSEAGEQGVQPATLTGSLARSRGPFRSLIARLGSGGLADEDWQALEEVLLGADLGPGLASAIVEEVRGGVGRSPDRAKVVAAIEGSIRARFAARDRSLVLEGGPPAVMLFVGVNGTGKTTTIGKLAHQLAAEGRRVVLAAGDTFRAAATEQVSAWAARARVEVVAGQVGADPASVIYDAIEHARAAKAEVVLCDTAGRLQSKTNLMEELRKIRRVAEKASGVVTEVLLVLDATTGQNGLRQAMVFHEAVELTGVVLTKLDGSAKGGIAVAIESELGIPIKLVGLGEGVADLAPFDPDAFAHALVGEAADV